MGYSFEEIQALQKPQRESARQAHIEQLQARASVGQKISELQADPRFEVWGRHVEAMKAIAQQRLDTVEHELTSNKLLRHDEYISYKIMQSSARGEVLAYNNALSVAKTLIEQGESALKELNTLTSEEKGV